MLELHENELKTLPFKDIIYMNTFYFKCGFLKYMQSWNL
jgi:hypothetical protein